MSSARLLQMQSPCRLCPRNCGAERAMGEIGYCGLDDRALVSSFGPHHGEESCLVGRGGSGTIFLGGCNLLCIFCQNDTISHERSGAPTTPDGIAETMTLLSFGGCENINFVTPTHFAPQLAEAVNIARGSGLDLPIVWNCGGYESVEALQGLEGLVDIYMPDLKTLDSDLAKTAMDAPDYPDRVREAIAEMHRQVGDLVIEDGRAKRGVMVRHLVMPDSVEDSKRCLEFLSKDISQNTFVNVMGQYRPCFKADTIQRLSRRPTFDEISATRKFAHSLGLRLDNR